MKELTYETFLMQKGVKNLVSKIIESVIFYDINNNISRISVIKGDSNNLQGLLQKALGELSLTNTGYINNNTIDIYIYNLLRNGSLYFVYNGGRYNLTDLRYEKNREEIMKLNKNNFSIELLVNGESYLESVYRLYSEGSEKIELDFNKAIVKIIPGSEIISEVNSCVIELIENAIKANLSPYNTTWFNSKWFEVLNNFFGESIMSKFIKFPNQFNIVLNVANTILEDINILEEGAHEFMDKMIKGVKEKSVEEFNAINKQLESISKADETKAILKKYGLESSDNKGGEK